MLGNFSFGDYFKDDAIRWAMEFYRDVLQLDMGRLWVTVHEEDDEAERIWRDDVGFPADRIQRLGEDNFWRMGDTGPCGPSSEIFWDLGPEHGPDGGPATGHDRYIEIWNLVFMQFDQRADGTRVPLPKPSIDTGAGLERNLLVVQGKTSIWDIDVFRPLIARAETVTGARYGENERTDVSLRIIAEHARAMTFMIADGVRPSNNERGYVLRRIIRRAVLHAYMLGARDLVLPADDRRGGRGDGRGVSGDRREPRHRGEGGRPRGAGVPLDAATRRRHARRSRRARRRHRRRRVLPARHPRDSRSISRARSRPRPAGASTSTSSSSSWRNSGRALVPRPTRRARRPPTAACGASVLDEVGPTEFTGRQELVTKANVVALVVDGARVNEVAEGRDRRGRARSHAVLRGVGWPGRRHRHDHVARTARCSTCATRATASRAPSSCTSASCAAVRCTTATRSKPRSTRRAETGSAATTPRPTSCTGRCVRCSARTCSRPVRWSRPTGCASTSAITTRSLRSSSAQVERLANEQVISDAPVRHYETTKAEAERIGAIAFFGEKYGEIVRVLEAGPSTELCGGTHVYALGFIGPIKIVSESSIGSNLRRIEALTGDGALSYVEAEEALLRRVGTLLRAAPKEIPDKIERLSEQVRTLQDEVQRFKAKEATAAAGAPRRARRATAQ